MTFGRDVRAAVPAPAKLNLCLRVLGRRPDGYHLLDSLVVPVTCFDHLTVRLEPAGAPLATIECRPPDAVPDGEGNLARRAAALFLQRTGWRVRVDVVLSKRIPIGAGLGGGSSDAAAVLRVLNALSGAAVQPDELARWSLELGADVPFFLFGRPARMRGIGEQLDPVPAPQVGPIVVAFPGCGLDTAAVYRAHDASLTTPRPASTIRPPPSGQEPLQDVLVNDLEAAASEIQPAVLVLRRKLCALGARGALMTGSGSAVFGVWRHRDDAEAAARCLRADGLWARTVEILERNPAIEVTT